MHDTAELRSQRRDLLKKARAILDPAKAQKRGLSATEQSQYDTLLSRANALREEIGRFEYAASAGVLGGDFIGNGADDDPDPRSFRTSPDERQRREHQRRETPEQRQHRQAFMTYLRAGERTPPDQMAILSRYRGGEFRDMGTGGEGAYPGATVGFFVPVGFVQNIISALKYFGPLLDDNVVDMMDTATGQPLPYPTENDVNILGERIGEGQQVTSQDVSLSQILFGAWKYSSKMVKVSIELLQDSAFDLETWLTRVLAIRLGRILVNDFTLGTGSAFQQPMGILTSVLANGNLVTAIGSSNNTGNADGGNTVGTDDLTNLIHSVDPLYRPNGSFMMNDSTLKAILKVKDKFGRPILDPSLQGAPMHSFLSYPLRINNSMPSLQTQASSPPVTVSTVIFGDLKRFIVRRVRDMSLLVLRERYADYGFARLSPAVQ
jgi:HK97 family phage major capsid protein